MTAVLEGRTAIVTGAGRGLGRAIAELLAAHGASVVVADVGCSIEGEGADPTVAREVASAIGSRAIAFTESVASPGIARQLVATATRSFGSIDIVVNNAAIHRDAPVFGLDPLDWDAVIRNNLSAAFYLIHAASVVMRDKGRGGRIVNIVQSAALHGTSGQAADAAAQAGLFGLTRVAALELAPERITVNAVARCTDTRLVAGGHHVASFVTALCTPSADDITGRLFAMRDREVLLFGSPRAVTSFDVETPEALPAGLVARLSALS